MRLIWSALCWLVDLFDRHWPWVAVLAALTLNVTACAAPIIPPAHQHNPDGGVAGACLNLESLGWCESKPKTMSCEAAFESSNSHVDEFGIPMQAVDLQCVADAQTCEEFDRCD